MSARSSGLGRLEGEVALVTGGASGLGRAIVSRFVAEGARVCVLDTSEGGLDALRRDHGDRVATTRGDVRSFEANHDAVAQCVEVFGTLDCAIANAGIWDYSRQLVDLSADELGAGFDELMGVNVKGPLLLAKAALPELVRSSGSLLFTVSNAGFYPDGGGALYTMSKHALVGLIRQLAFEFAPAVRVNGVAPGAIETDLRGPASLGMEETSISSLGLADTAESFVPLGRLATPQEYAAAYVFFAARSEAAPATGSILNFDGGFGVRGLSRLSGGRRLRERFAEGK
jgi:NAD(P)-dependent dehydrogenase (short-subunit alcohol dehydrogenase family)